LSALSPRVGVIVVGGDGREAAARLSGSDRAFGIVGADADPAAFKAAVHAVAAGFRVLPPALRPTRLTPDTTDPAEEDALLDEPLTPREHEVLELAAQGLSNHGIATRLGISDHTVKFHLASVYGKLGVRSRTAAVRRGLSRGLLTI
jgi:DNA-binding NarL/FixJ family response regulator